MTVPTNTTTVLSGGNWRELYEDGLKFTWFQDDGVTVYKQSVLTAEGFSGDFVSSLVTYLRDHGDFGDGNGLLHGAGDPTTEVGVDGDYYLKNSPLTLFGPKATTWPTGVSLIGSQGIQGIQGIQGVPGADGADGADGAPGAAGAAGVGVSSAEVGEDGNLHIVLTDSTDLNAGAVRGENGADGATAVQTLAALVASLPTVDPGVAGELWNSAGTLMVSSGGA